MIAWTRPAGTDCGKPRMSFPWPWRQLPCRPPMRKLQKDTRARNTHSSTAIEGNPLTLEEVRALEEGTMVKGTA